MVTHLVICYLIFVTNLFVCKGENVIFNVCVMRHRSLGPGELCGKLFIFAMIFDHGSGTLHSSQD